MTGLGGDTYALSNGSQSGVLSVNGSTSFLLMPSGPSYTLTELKNGSPSGIGANTKVAIWIGVDTVTGGGSTSATITSISGL
jgi:hypothetical protein